MEKFFEVEQEISRGMARGMQRSDGWDKKAMRIGVGEQSRLGEKDDP